MSTYEKQLRWKKAVLSLSKATKIKEDEEADSGNNFTPQYFSVPLHDFTGSAKQSTDISSQVHVARQSKGRMEKKELADRLKWSDRGKTPAPINRSKTTGSLSCSEEPATENVFLSNFSKNNVRSKANNQDNSERRSSCYSDGDDMPVVALLEKERKEWQLERLKLIHCIHLQQLELSQRSAAAYDRATDIAKEFARSIEGFEERLIVVESNVQKEIMALKAIAESIKAAVTSNNLGRIG